MNIIVSIVNFGNTSPATPEWRRATAPTGRGAPPPQEEAASCAPSERGRGAAVDGERERHRGLGREAKAPGLGREAAASGVGEGGSDVWCWECEREREWGMRRLGFPHLYTVTCIRAKMGFS